ncbi:hypothetical protein BOX15_Mlig007159g1 [Macrostomum lignano]|uniref:Uncharacterized protein n=2 Tax=Macrostomum lignano TaxID=282301 RepID=A0A267DHS5_9PLAT|nr:hypothetical protein BOX15_Mlig007159g1 [Macrostomum lignano]
MESNPTPAQKVKFSISALLPGLMDSPVVGLITRLTKIHAYENNKAGSGQVFSFTLTDETADIRVSVFGKDLKSLLEMCQTVETVRISGGWIKKADPRYNTTENEYEMSVSVDKSGTIMTSNETVNRRSRDYRRISEISACQMKTKVDVRGIISAVEKPKEVKTGAGKLVDLAKVTIVDRSGSSVSCTFWASSSAQVNNWSIGDILAIHGSQVQEYAQMISLGCSQAEVHHWPENSQEFSDLTEWYNGATASQQHFEAVRATQIPPPEQQASHDEEMTLHYPERMFHQFNNMRRIRLRFGSKEVTFSRDSNSWNQQMPTGSTPRPLYTSDMSQQNSWNQQVPTGSTPRTPYTGDSSTRNQEFLTSPAEDED